MRGITFTAFATLLLVTSGMIGSGHIALAHNSRVIENSGNYQESQQLCGNSCTVTSSNVITQGSASRTALPPVGTHLSLAVNNVTNGLSLRSSLTFSANNQIVTASTVSHIQEQVFLLILLLQSRTGFRLTFLLLLIFPLRQVHTHFKHTLLVQPFLRKAA